MSNVAKSFDIRETSLSILHNYFDRPTKLFPDQYLIKFLDSTEPFFLCMKICKKSQYTYYIQRKDIIMTNIQALYVKLMYIYIYK